MTSFTPFSINCGGRLVMLDKPAVMGIINVTPDSFYGASRSVDVAMLGERAAAMVEAGADIIDLGACSTRPGARYVDAAEECARLLPAVREVRRAVPHVPLSVDTFRATVAAEAVAAGAHIINDVSGASADDKMLEMVAALKVPYVLTHSRGDSVSMDTLTCYPNGVTAAVIEELSGVYNKLRLLGVNDIIIDPGLGFAKTPEQCYTLLRDLPVIRAAFNLPILIGASRKRMVTEPLGITADESLCATTALNAMALMQGASVLRVHDVTEARQAVTLYGLLTDSAAHKNIK